jgi:hypothetical protein
VTSSKSLHLADDAIAVALDHEVLTLDDARSGS